MTILWIASGAFIGAILRSTIGQVMKKWTDSTFPWATLFVNVTGSFGLGYLYAHTAQQSLILFLGIGFFGSFTTFSTLKLELMRFVTRDWIRFGLYLLTTYLFGLVAAYIGWSI
ncbi:MULTISPECIES: fluoride efflux transporter FluC [Exiguobacterium]|uniref:fluoride efflux transporter FluC n=1 Tax=Exiguobacterium TaxID=33986 RepID=UPI00047A1188|nr:MULTISPECIES: CrcB family protein [Exiguobacterium]